MFRLDNQLIKLNGSSLHSLDLKDHSSWNFQLALDKRDTDSNETEPWIQWSTINCILAGSWFIKVDEFDVDKQYLMCWGDLLSYNLLQAIPEQITYNQPRFISLKLLVLACMGPFNYSLTFRNYGPNKASTSVGSSGLYFSIITSQLLVDPY